MPECSVLSTGTRRGLWKGRERGRDGGTWPATEEGVAPPCRGGAGHPGRDRAEEWKEDVKRMRIARKDRLAADIREALDSTGFGLYEGLCG